MEQFLELVYLEKRHAEHERLMNSKVIQSSMLSNRYEPVTMVCSLNML